MTRTCTHCGEAHPGGYSHCPKTGKALTVGQALVGRIIADRYRILGLLGEGGMGAVYVAEHLLIGRRVALKRLHPELAYEDRAVRRFQREARAAAATGHENIVDVLDLGFAEDGAPFLVMELLKGETLADVIAREGRLAPTRACFIVGQLLAALAAVHRQGVVHRDLKPDNVFLTRRSGRSDYVKVLDFGISKMHRDDGDDLPLTRTGVILGTPFYLSPEQARGCAFDHRVDLHAAGVILYEALTGRLPFREHNYHALLQSILACDPPRLDEIRPDIDPALARSVHGAITGDPDARYPDAHTMLGALLPFGAVDPGDEALEQTEAGELPLSAGPGAPRTDTEPQAGRGPRQEARFAPAPRSPEAPSETWSIGTELRPRTRVKGSLVTATLEYVEREYGRGALESVLGSMDQVHQRPMRGMILPVAWVPLEAYIALLSGIERRFGDGDGARAMEVGAAIAARDLPQAHRLLIQTATPAIAVTRLPQLWGSYHDEGQIRVQEQKEGSCRVDVRGVFPINGVYAMALAGFYRELLRLTGARRVFADVTASHERGDDRTTIVLEWD